MLGDVIVTDPSLASGNKLTNKKDAPGIPEKMLEGLPIIG